MDANARKACMQEFYSWTDLRVGVSLNIHGRQMLLTSADDFTRRFYKQHAGASDEDFTPIEARPHCSDAYWPAR